MRRPVLVLGLALVLASCVSGPAHGVASSLTVRTAAADGHPTHPVWYHDGSVVRVGARLVLAWNSSGGSVEARTWNLNDSSWATKSVRISKATLDCGCIDSSGTNPNRHDVPTVFADPAGRVYAIYGGGTASHTGTKTGPYFRAAANLGAPKTWGPEQRLSIAGAMYDIEGVRDNLGTTYLIGQQGDNGKGAGSLLSVVVPAGTSSLPGTPQPARTLVQGGDDAAACAWQSSPGCDIFVIGRIAVGPADPAHPTSPSPLYLTWGWTEKNLSGTCGDPAGFCDRGLYFAQSFDGGTHWLNAGGTASVSIASAPIAYDDARFQVVAPTTNVGLFKAIGVTGSYPGTPWLVFQPNADLGSGTVDVTSWTGSAWSSPTVVDSTRSWDNHLVFRAYPDGRLAIWSDIAQTGSHASELAQWTLAPAGTSWTASRLSVGANWFLTGRAAGAAEALVWRAPGTTGATEVRFALVPEPS